MKRLICMVWLALIATLTFAQTESEHLTFKGVPIDGTLNEYITKMKQKGFTLAGRESGMAALEGDFAGYKNCTVVVATLEQKDLVSKISVLFPERDTWSGLADNYFSLKEMLTEKYGKPADCLEKFQSYSDPTDDNSRMHELEMDRCKYVTTFLTKKGDIQLYISHNSVTSCFVVLSYYDKANTDTIRAKAMEDL